MRHFAALVRPPAVRALLIQLISFFAISLAAAVIEARAGLAMPFAVVAALQGAAAALLSWRCRLAPWWWLIQLVFPLGLLAAPLLPVPPAAFLLLFLVFLALYWTTFRTQVPFFPSGPRTHEAVAALLPASAPVRFIDVGSGLGGLVLALAERRPESSFTGIELAPLPWLVSVMRARSRRSRAAFLRGDYEALDFAEHDVVFAYLSPAAMPGLWRQARGQMRPGTLLLSYEFPVAGVTPDFVMPPDARNASLYGWRM